jgi:mannose-6-phosphate isomerase-like protein (cupin superfamily)
MHYVSKIQSGSFAIPRAYAEHSKGFGRATYVEHGMGSVHMGVGICRLSARGSVQSHVHSLEESFYVFRGNPILQIEDKAYPLRPGNFGLISTGKEHAWSNSSEEEAQWLEMQAPQPRAADYGRDTFFVNGNGQATKSAVPAEPVEAPKLMFGHFDESSLPRPGGPSQMEGFNPTTGVAIKMFVDRSFGAIHQSLFLIQYAPGAKIDPHDHTFEESYYIVSGRVKAVADGKTHDLGPGDVIWTGVGCIHSFENVGSEPVRWIETQAPLPPAKEIFRFERDWAQSAAREREAAGKG